MGDVVNFDDYAPRIVIPDDVNKRVHVIPVSLARDWAYGRAPLPNPSILRAIMWDWLCSYEADDGGRPPPAA